MKKITKEFKIGLSVIVALGILFFGINYLKGLNLFKSSNYYIVYYDNVAGLETAAAVTIDGYKVGQVRDIEFDYANPGKIKVTLGLNKDLKVPVDSKASIEASLLGGPSIVLHLGKEKRSLDVGGEIKSEVAPDMMSTLTGDILPKVTDILPILDSLMLNLNATAYNINLLSGHPSLTSSVSRLDGITSNILALSSELHKSLGTELPPILRGARTSVTHLDSMTYNLAILSRELKQIQVQPTMDKLNQVMDNAEGLTANLQTLSHNLNDSEGTLGMFMKDPELYNRLSQVSADIDSLIVDIKRNPKRYISIKLL